MNFGDKYTCSNSKGAAKEMLVCADLLRRGFYAYRSVSPSAPFDVIAVTKEGKTISIEVRTARKLKRTGDMSFKRHGNANCFAAVTDTEIVYEPSLEVLC